MTAVLPTSDLSPKLKTHTHCYSGACQLRAKYVGLNREVVGIQIASLKRPLDILTSLQRFA